DYLYNSVKWWDFESPWLLEQYEAFRHIAPSIGFPESHDTKRLAADLLAAGVPEAAIEPHYRQAYAFAASYSTGVMMPMGFEFGWSQALDVVATGTTEPEPKRFDLTSGTRLVVEPLEVRVFRSARIHPTLNAERPPSRSAGEQAARSEPRQRLHPRWRPEARIAIEDVSPQLDDGRYPVKRVLGDEFEVQADIFRDGHDKLCAIV